MVHFRRLVEADLPVLVRWFSAPHARAWYGEGPDYVAEVYGPELVAARPRAFVAVHEARDVGLFEWVRLGDHPAVQRAYGVEDPETANVDVIVGEPDVAHRGLGPALIHAFLAQIVFANPRVPSVVIDPETDNAIAIRAYEKVGFRYVRASADDAEGNSVYLLELTREELAAGPPAPRRHLRPGRAHELDLARAIDDDACRAYAEIGLSVAYGEDHPFFADEEARWARALAEGRLLFACTPSGEPVGFVAYGLVDGRPYVHQLSVRRDHQRRGYGGELLTRVQRWSIRPGELWLTTWSHVPWNGPWYARRGFVEVPAPHGPEIAAIVAAENGALPAPDRRVVMRYAHPDPMMRW